MLFGNGPTVPLFVMVQKWHLGEGLSYRRRGHFTESQVHCLWITPEMDSHGRHGCTSQRSGFKAKFWTFGMRSNRLFHRSQKRGGKAKSEGENGSRHEVAGQSVVAFVVQVVAAPHIMRIVNPKREGARRVRVRPVQIISAISA